jgi:hypothetical protein
MVNISVNAHQGRPLPLDWRSQAPAKAREAEADYLARMETEWRRPLNGSREGIIARDARLTNDSASRADCGPEATVRMDGRMQLVGHQEEWEIWKDSVSGATVWKKTK